MPATTRVIGSLYNAAGTLITTGKLYITLPQDMVAGDGTKVVPSTVTVDLAAVAGAIDVNLTPTADAEPSGMFYFVEYDPLPSDTTKARRQKEGYWWNWWNVPSGGPVNVGLFPPAHRRPLPEEVLPTAPIITATPDFNIVTWQTNALTSNNVVKTGSTYDLDRAVFITPSTYTPPTTFEFRATFRAVGAQHIGFSLDLVAAPWILISTSDGVSQNGTGLFARVNTSVDAAVQIATAAECIGSSHLYKIVWGPTSIEFFIDGVSKNLRSVTYGTPLNGMASDFFLDTIFLTISDTLINGARVYI